jgi:hypothetical protein
LGLPSRDRDRDPEDPRFDGTEGGAGCFSEKSERFRVGLPPVVEDADGGERTLGGVCGVEHTQCRDAREDQ